MFKAFLKNGICRTVENAFEISVNLPTVMNLFIHSIHEFNPILSRRPVAEEDREGNCSAEKIEIELQDR